MEIRLENQLRFYRIRASDNISTSPDSTPLDRKYSTHSISISMFYWTGAASKTVSLDLLLGVKSICLPPLVLL